MDDAYRFMSWLRYRRGFSFEKMERLADRLYRYPNEGKRLMAFMWKDTTPTDEEMLFG